MTKQIEEKIRKIVRRVAEYYNDEGIVETKELIALFRAEQLKLIERIEKECLKQSYLSDGESYLEFPSKLNSNLDKIKKEINEK